MLRCTRCLAGLFVYVITLATAPAAKSADWWAGFSRVDVTPTEPVRMSGYASRDHANEGVDTPLHVRCFALKSTSDETASLLITVDTIGLPGTMTNELARNIEGKHGTPREKVVFSSSHTHCGPHLLREPASLFSTEMSESEVAAAKRYRIQLERGIMTAVEDALGGMQPAKLSYAVGEATFAANRRVLTDGKWTGFGVQAGGPVDHTVPVLKISGKDDQVIGVVFNYACHCTTLGGSYYRINAEWAGYATSQLERKYSGSVALCTIGCGADANPSPRGTLDAAKLHGRTLAKEVERLVDSDLSAINAPMDARFDYAALSFELPTQEELEQRKSDPQLQVKRHAEHLLGVLEEHGRLPATYPVPIQSWKFGDELTMIFLGGEVVVDYALRLKQTLDDPNLWVTAYANDVLGYIASERMISEGGYEYDRAGIYRGLPGPWATGTEDRLIARIETMLESRGRSRALAVEDALKSFQLTEGFKIELVASEPLVTDPINLAFDGKGRLWVVEMGDYPLGENGGRVKRLEDTDGDGVFDHSTLFLADLAFPTGVFPWRDGVLISAAPDILFARDTDDDGKADDVQTMYSGFRLANPQHRVSGFTYGLDHSLHLASGDNLRTVESKKTGQSVDASGHDVQIWPDSGQVGVTSGRTQYIRSRNDWGEWFGNDNSRPMYHFPIDDSYLERNPSVRYSGTSQQLFTPPVAPPVFPVTAATERFNDLFAANRFTSACSAIVARLPALAIPGHSDDVAIICEPVHNLVHRAVLRPHGATYRAERAPEEVDSELLASSDPWFRPVRAYVGPDGHLYVVDMYRETIEHPEWIPESWQQQLDLRAGADRGRIYRVSSVEPPSEVRPLESLATDALVRELESVNGARRDLAQQLIIERDDEAATPLLRKLARDTTSPHSCVHALSILQVQQQLDDELLLNALDAAHPGVLLVAIRLAEPRLKSELEGAILNRLARTAKHQDDRVVMQTALALGQSDAASAGETLASIVRSADLDHWTKRAISTSATPHAALILTQVLRSDSSSDASDLPVDLLTDLLVTAQSGGSKVTEQFRDVFANSDASVATRIRLAAGLTEAIGSDNAGREQLAGMLGPLYGEATELARNHDREEHLRCEALQLVGIGIGSSEQETTLLLELLNPSTPISVQQEAVDRLARTAKEDACQHLVERWPSLSKSVRDHCVSQMLQRRNWTERLLTALESKQIDVADLTPAARQQLTHTGSRSMRVRAQNLTTKKGSPEKRDLIRTYLAEMNGEPDTTKGAALFKQHCAVCHVAGPDGAAVGASLDNLTDRSDRTLVTAILDPNLAVDPKYQSYVIRTFDDRILVGAVEEEAGRSVTLAHADGKRTTIARAEIADLKNSRVSLMPEGLQDVLSPTAMRDLAGFLQTNPTTNERQQP